MTTPHSWTGLTIATPDGVGVYVKCATCALVVPVTHLAQWQGRACHVARTREQATDTATVAAFLASLDFGLGRARD